MPTVSRNSNVSRRGLLTVSARLVFGLFVLCVAFASGGCGGSDGTPNKGTAKAPSGPVTIRNVSYDPTREFYKEFNKNFEEYWMQKTGQVVSVEQSHGGSGKQARAVIDGNEADVVTLALAYDIDAISSRAKLLPADWQGKLPNNSAPYTSTIVFLVRKGNPKGIRDWSDLVKEDVEVVTPDPKTSGGARWNFLAAWGAALKKELGSFDKLKDPAAAADVSAAQAKAREFVRDLYAHVKQLDQGARQATDSFVKRGTGDVLLAWENEAYLAIKELGPDAVDIVVPSVSILAEPTVALVETTAAKKGTTEVAKAYLQHLYSPQGQQLAAKHHFRPSVADAISEEQRKSFAAVELFSIDEVFGGWTKAQATFFDDGGTFDEIQKENESR